MSAEPLVRSCVPGIVWPGIATAAGAQMLSLQWQLEKSQWWSPECLRDFQLRQLRTLIAHATAHVPHYHGALHRAGIDSASSLDSASFSRWPVLRKRDVRQNELALRASALPGTHGVVTESRTTGSTGTPVRVYRTSLEASFMRALVLRNHLLHGRDMRLKFGALRAGVETGEQQGWGVASTVFETGPSCAVSLYAPLEEQFDWLLRERPAYLISTPLALRELVLLSRRRAIRPDGLVAVMTFAAMQPADLRELVRETWKIPVTDTYSCVEAGTLAIQCPGHDHYLVQAENVFLEVLREDGSACCMGETGRVVITPLHNFAMPLIRYELGDYAEVGAPCPSGRGLPTLARIAGRVRNLFRYPTGERRSPNVPPDVWLETPIVQYRLLQRTVKSIEVQYVMERPLSGAEKAGLAKRLAGSLGYPFEVSFVRKEWIERGPGGKYEEFLCLVPEAPDE